MASYRSVKSFNFFQQEKERYELKKIKKMGEGFTKE